MFSLFGILMVLAAFPSTLTAQQSGKVTCFKSQYIGLDVNHCRRALRNIVYDTNGHLDSRSSTVFTWHQTCVINIQKLQQNQPTRQWVEATVLAIAQTCRQSGGIRKYTDGTQAQVYRSTASNVYNVNQPMCQKSVCNFQPNDCLRALNQLPVDQKGNFNVQSTDAPSSKATWGNCTVLMQTTDSSSFRISHPEVNPSFKRIVNQCGSRWGNDRQQWRCPYIHSGIELLNTRIATNNLTRLADVAMEK
ncbi:uncharacterized protein PGTG_00039 [Puccinia graminis f. sp. tritici CRL 75-36-700-3]|uniref:Secreted protein n=1 Tax=Puccinia graminis f. sp. tritici (strain CRL 75-36-700-3 / race SCCL) TaxID=418459 RepID=E3JQ00_PUCGT|nr:uncharacterized protein PGTG_00039 [Puccinia graminis f. sp. tritici CRL 75-36-700-3]EFP74083.1 hypothetical protein PGTG_00039 [Puccinia graminis f. sp. tritici CRL 75-36-700-3]